MELIGRLIETGDVEAKTANFSLRKFVIEVFNQRDPRYNDYVEFQLTNANVSILDAWQIGQMIKVRFEIKGRKWCAQDGKVKYITTLSAWKIEEPSANSSAPSTTPQEAAANMVYESKQSQSYYQQPPTNNDKPVGDLPF